VPTLRHLDSLAAIDPAAWDRLNRDSHPFTTHAFLHGLEQHGCLRASLGWRAHHVTLWRGATLVAAAPAYLKTNSHGEFVFDHAWADAYERTGLAYYPKLLCAVPYTPVTGPRLLVAADEPPTTRTELAQALVASCESRGFSGVHVNFATDDEAAALSGLNWLARSDWQFHWANAGWTDFDAFLAALTHKRRKEIRRERAAVAKHGIHFRWRHGHDVTDAELEFAFACYARTFAEKGNYPALTRAFFVNLPRALGAGFVLVLAELDDTPIAMALSLRSDDTLYGRYWGADRYVPGLHFECCYYQGIDYCLAHGLARFEPGAQGEHKIARGFLPVATRSHHWLADPRLREAVRRSLVGEAQWLERYHRSLLAQSPFAERSS
jgi:predicted N-acyltransferase